MIELMTRYGYLAVFFGVLADQIGLPLPSMLLLIAAGALAGLGQLNFALVIVLATVASLLGNFLWYEIGRRRGAPVLGFLCRLSLEQDSCVRDTEDTFVRRGAKSLLIAKFFPGLSTVAPPLAGIVGMKISHFLLFDGFGALIWAAIFTGAGYLFSDQFGQVADYATRFGSLALAISIAGLVGYIALKFIARQRFLRQLMIARITSEELKQKLDDGEAVMIVDLRHRLDFESDPRVIPGALRIAIEDLKERHEELPRDRDIILYCTCPNEATSASAAVKLRRYGIKHVRPLAGGLLDWQNHNYPTESRTAETFASHTILAV
jgi:membrane protein DedA with SNARE-associated domain/rhodanese-related sulfurtransferase